jgi:DNA helicase-2/ATP-dependent DNA helicase PcrA
MHKSKGLEAKAVIVIGCAEGIAPHHKSFEDPKQLEEERRLMYVAVTRAKERLYLTRANSRYMYGNREYMVQSRFLKEAKSVLNPYQTITPTSDRRNDYYNERYSSRENIIGDSTTSSSGGYSSNYAKKFLSNNVQPNKTGVSTSKYKSGVKVKHVKFGEGTVITTKGEGDNLIVDVAFKGVGIKSLSAKFAPMEII